MPTATEPTRLRSAGRRRQGGARAGACAAAAAWLLSACGGGDTASGAKSPGEPQSARTAVLDKSAGVLQDKPPIEALNSYLDGFHFVSGRMSAQMEAHHYCSIVNEDLTQCVIHDGNTRDAKIMGVEYIVSDRVFATLPSEEKALWHSHVHEVKSGQLIAPGIPEAAEKALMKKLILTYGKTWHTWPGSHAGRQHDLPYGVPQLMMGFTADGQADATMVAARDQRMGVSSAQRKAQRADIPVPAVDAGADGWQKGRALQLSLPLSDPTGVPSK